MASRLDAVRAQAASRQKDPMRIVRRLMTAVSILGVLVVCTIGLVVTTSFGQSYLASVAGSVASTDGQSVEITGLSGLATGSIRVGRIALGDKDGVVAKLEGVEVDWSPLALLSQKLAVQNLKVSRTEILRVPQSPDAEGAPGSAPADQGTEASGSAGLLPVEIDAFQFGEIVLGEELIERGARMTARGSAVILGAPLRARIKFDAERTDGTAGSLRTDIAYVPDRDQLDMDLALNEPVGGLLARALGLADLPAVSINVTSSGTLKNWVSELRVAFNNQTTLTGQARVTESEMGHRITAALNGRPGPLLPRLITPVLAGNVELALEVMRKADGSVSIAAADLNSATTRFSARGGLDFTTNVVDIETNLVFGDADSEIAFTLPGDSEARIRSVKLRGRTEGVLDDAQISLSGSVAGISAMGYRGTDLRFNLSSQGADLLRQSAPFVVAFAGLSLETPFPDANALLAGPVGIEANGKLDDGIAVVQSATMSTAVAQANLAGRAEMQSGALALALKGQIAKGASEQLTGVFGDGPIQLATRLGLDREGRLSVSDMQVQGHALSLSGEAEIGPDDVDATLYADVADLSRFSPEMAGKTRATLTASGSLEAPEVSLETTSEDIRLAGNALEDPTFTFQGVLSASQPRGALNASAHLNGKRIVATGHLVSDTDSTRLDALRVAVGNAEVKGAMQNLLGDAPTGQFKISVPDLAVLGPLLLRDDLAGGIRGTFALAPDSSGLSLKVDVESQALSAAGVNLRNSRIDAVVADLTGEVKVDGAVEVAAIKTGTTTIGALSLTASSRGAATNFVAKAKLDGAPLSARGRLISETDVMTVELNEMSGAFQGVTAKLNEPATVRVRNGTAEIGKARLNIGGGVIAVTGRAGETLDLLVAFDAFPAKAVDPFVKQGLAGTIVGSVKATGTSAAPQVAYDLKWLKATATPLRDAGVPALSIAAKGRYAGDRVGVNTAITGGGFDTRIGGNVVLGPNPKADIAVKGRLPFEAAAATLAQSGLRLKGAAALNVKVAGALTAPQITGTITTSNATFIETASSLVIENIKATVKLSPNQAKIRELTGRLGKNGRVNVTGTIGTDPKGDFPANLKIAMRKARYSDGSIVTATVSGDITLKGSLLKGPKVGGRIDIERADVSIPERLTGSVAALGVEHVNAPAGVAKQNRKFQQATNPKKKNPKNNGGGPTLAVDVSAPNQIYVRGRGLDTELGGKLRLTGPASAPQAVGGFKLIKGKLDILGKRILFERGIITFAGSLDPVVDFAASTTANGITATVLVTGPASTPTITLSSSPALPQDEVLAQLLFAKPLASLSPTQIVQLASAIATLTGAGGNTSALDRIRNGLGLDTLDITSDDNGGTAVGVGRYINDRTYIGVKQGTTTDSTSVTTDIDITDNLKAKGEVNSQGRSKAGIFFEKEY